MWKLNTPTPRPNIHALFLGIYLLIVCHALEITASGSTPVNQTLALQILYDGTNGPEWVYNGGDPWNFSQPLELIEPCNGWDGITCECVNIATSDNTRTDVCNIVELSLFWVGLEGTLPSSLSMLQYLTVLNLGFNLLSGTIPLIVITLPGLVYVDLGYNLLTGTIPPEVTQLDGLQELNLFFNFFTGSLPVGLDNWTSMQVLDLTLNEFTGSIPLGLSNMTALEKIFLDNNQFTGSVPDPSRLTNLIHIHLGNNFLSNELPRAIWALSELVTLSIFNNNLLSGTIPTIIGGLHKLNFLELYSTAFSGSVPYEIGFLTNLKRFEVDGNFMTGTIPDSFVLCKALERIDFHNNLLTGDFLRLAAQLDLHSLEIHYNLFTGPVPIGLGPMLNAFNLDLTSIQCEFNFLTSTLPNYMGSLTSLRFVDFSGNYLTSTIPADFFPLIPNDALDYVYLFSNHLEGTIPAEIGNLYGVIDLLLHDNILTGTIPSTIANCSKLVSLLLQNNNLEGVPDLPFRDHEASFQQLQNVDLSSNGFSGTIPTVFFDLPAIAYFATSQNCFHGSLPENICGAVTLQQLYLEGVRSGEKCKTRIFGSLSDVYMSNALPGTIPHCLWDMPELRFLFLSGNLLEGTFPTETLRNVTSIQFIGLSYNRLSGELPVFLQGLAMDITSRSMGVRRDFSHNRLIGSLADLQDQNSTRASGVVDDGGEGGSIFSREALLNNSETAYVALNVNRLSGEVPSNSFIRGLRNINILAGNIFTCEAHSDLPKNDPHYHFYTCGSDAIDLPLLLWVVLLGVAALVGAVLWLISHFAFFNTKTHKNHSQNQLTKLCTRMLSSIHCNISSLFGHLRVWHAGIDALDPHENREVVTFKETLQFVRVTSMYITGFILTTFLLFYCLGKSQWGWYTHVDQYRWFFSAAYLSGKGAALVMVLLLLSLLSLSIYLVTSQHKLHVTTIKSGRVPSSVTRSKSVETPKMVTHQALKNFLSSIACFVINMICVLSVQGSFVYVTTWHNISPDVVVALQLLLASFSIVWDNLVVLKVLIARFPSYLTHQGRIQLQNLIIIFNGVVAPVIVVSFTDPNCFSELIANSNEISTTSLHEYCVRAKANGCQSYLTMELTNTFKPPFMYSYICSSSVITRFIPVFVITNILLSFVLPVVLIVLLYISNKSKRCKAFCMSFLPPLLFPSHSVSKQLFSPHVIMSKLLHHVALLLTFGVACPPLAVAILITVCITTFAWQLLTGRYVVQRRDKVGLPSIETEKINIVGPATVATSSGGLLENSKGRSSSSCYSFSENISLASTRNMSDINGDAYLYASEMFELNSLCDGVWQCPQASIWVIIDCTAFFSSLLVFDIAGDRSGWLVAGLCFSLPMLCVPLLLRIIFLPKTDSASCKTRLSSVCSSFSLKYMLSPLPATGEVELHSVISPIASQS